MSGFLDQSGLEYFWSKIKAAINAKADKELSNLSDYQRALANLGGRPSRNCLINGYFVGGGSQKGHGIFPVNQRGQTRYDGGLSIDGCTTSTTVSSGTIELTDNGITLNHAADGGIIDAKFSVEGINLGDTITMSIVVADEIYTRTGSSDSMGLEQIGNTGVYWYWDSGTNKPVIRFGYNLTGPSPVISALYVAKGSVQNLGWKDDSGIHFFETPVFSETLARCQSRLLVLNQNNDNWVFIGQGNAISAIRCFIAVPTPVTMRTKPVISFNPEIIRLRNGVNYPQIKSISVYRYVENQIVLDIASEGLAVGSQYDLLYGDLSGDKKFIFTAE